MTTQLGPLPAGVKLQLSKGLGPQNWPNSLNVWGRIHRSPQLEEIVYQWWHLTTGHWGTGSLSLSLFLLQNFLFFFSIYLFLAALGLSCCLRAFSSCGEQGLLFIAVRVLLIVVASLVVEHGLQARGLQYLWHTGSVVVARGLSCSEACGIFPDQGSSPCPLHWQADS